MAVAIPIHWSRLLPWRQASWVQRCSPGALWTMNGSCRFTCFLLGKRTCQGYMSPGWRWHMRTVPSHDEVSLSGPSKEKCPVNAVNVQKSLPQLPRSSWVPKLQLALPESKIYQHEDAGSRCKHGIAANKRPKLLGTNHHLLLMLRYEWDMLRSFE